MIPVFPLGLSQFFVVNEDGQIEAGPYVVRAPATAYINNLRRHHERSARMGRSPWLPKPDGMRIFEANFVLLDTVEHTVKAKKAS
ncbi:hypothetical protein WL21_09725 [Burkholderia ubonensis]|uniref:hypothetical protein n=1 Tax=Burkholderia ubonensis TaxID=101571 RepID=UPI000753B665|nr:hypothetical protein [Burkholderia ubonensis]KVO83301.1 hypothetical protein WJ81_22945 [Burkholderia ubonensis]KVW40302.1 hypothetical protein WK94_23385 [Burkholderia ubonensis]KVZ58947.1 hypothetical protein WL20_20340 [Burkholderia ubonensis]KVZ70576.1 hypothetical protein WL21_09725 [Burkholderia ubonensis]